MAIVVLRTRARYNKTKNWFNTDEGSTRKQTQLGTGGGSGVF